MNKYNLISIQLLSPSGNYKYPGDRKHWSHSIRLQNGLKTGLFSESMLTLLRSQKFRYSNIHTKIMTRLNSSRYSNQLGDEVIIIHHNGHVRECTDLNRINK